MRPRLVPLAVALALGLVTAACAQKADTVPLVGGTTTTAGSGTAATVPATRPTVELLDAGAAPRTQLRFHPTGTCTEPVAVTQTAGLQVGTGGSEQASSDQSVEFDLTYRCTKITSDAITTRARYDAAKVLKADLGTGSTIDSVLQGFVGHETEVVYDRRGQVLSATAPNLDLPASIKAVADQLLNNLGNIFTGLSAPFPDEAVGVGAHWRVTGEADIAGLHARQVLDVTITKLAGDDVEGTTTQTISFLKGTVTIPGVPASAGTVTLQDGGLSGSGTVMWDLAHPVTLGHQTADGTISMSIDASGVHESLREAQHQDMTIAPRTT